MGSKFYGKLYMSLTNGVRLAESLARDHTYNKLRMYRLSECSVSIRLLFLGFFLNLVRGLLVLLTDLIELLHVIEKLCATLQSNE